MVSLHNIHFAYRKKRPLFEGLNVELKPGCIYGLLGRNGAGKTSLLRLMSGLLFPQKGNCRVGPHDPVWRSPAFLQEVFFIPEEFDLPPVRIRDYASVNAPFYPKFDYVQFGKYLQEFDLDERLTMTEMSHGQKKKTFACFALAANTSLLIMDEPTNGLDIPSKAQFRKLIAAAMNENRVVVVSTHQVRDLEQLIDPIIILDKNRVIVHASLEEIGNRFCFSTVSQLSEAIGEVFYSESGVRGISVIGPANECSTGRVDLEMLFNAALNQPDTIEKALRDS
jgi:ABC-2 type transport system ATP-binding protein